MSTELAVVPREQYIVLQPEARENIRENLGGDRIMPTDLLRIANPSGKSMAWMVPSLDGDPEAVTTLTGVILHHSPKRNRWGGSISGDPPLCTSRDGKVGIGDPGGNCDTCPYNQWKSAIDENGNPSSGKACKEARTLLFQRPAVLLPNIVTVPTMSLRNYRAFMFDPRRPHWSWVTEIRLRADQNKRGTTFPRFVFRKSGLLDDDTAQAMRQLGQQLASAFAEVEAVPDDFDHDVEEA